MRASAGARTRRRDTGEMLDDAAGRDAHNGADWAETKRSYELMARYVHPHFQRNSNALRDFSYDDAKGKYATAGAQMKSAVQAAIDNHAARKA